MANKSIIYDYEYLKEISDNYQICMDSLQIAISNCLKAKNCAKDEYVGMADEILENVFAKIEEHLYLLYVCCETSKIYVMNSADEIKATDSKYK